MFDQLNLEKLGERIRQVDRGLIASIGERMKLSLQIEEYKRSRQQPIFRQEVEKRRLDEICDLARGYGINPEFARSIFYTIIGESCKTQMIQLQERNELPDQSIDEDQWSALLKQNLLKLTAHCAKSYDEKYDSDFYATHLHTDFEQVMILEACRQYQRKGIALDLGCGTGKIALTLGDYFDHVIGYDISPDMIKVANNKCADTSPNKFLFEAVDIEEGIPQPDNSVSFVAMSLGFASDLRLLPKVLREVHRTLTSDGTVFLSFYNAEALIYRWEFIPWPVGLAAEINLRKHCLEVRWSERNTYAIYARPYTADEIRELMPCGLSITKLKTHPTICSILPDTLFSDERVRKSIAAIDMKLADENMGAYITVVAKKS